MKFEIIDVINIITIFQLIMLIILLIHKGKKNISIFLLISFFTVELIGISNYFFSSINKEYYSIHYIFIPVSFLYSPIFYFYIKSLVNNNFSISKPLYSLHLLPAVLSCVYLIFNSDLKTIQVIDSLYRVQIIIYNLLCFYSVNQYQKKLKNYVSNLEKQNLMWLKIILTGYIIACIIFEISSLIDSFTTVLWTRILVFSCFLVFFNILFYKTIISPQVFFVTETKTKYESSSLTSSEAEEFLYVIKKYMEDHKPYLDPTLTLKKFSQVVNISERNISQIINQYCNQNFYTFINTYRIDQAKKLLISEPSDTIILKIAFESGFNSKATFNQLFKNYTGLTPSTYKKSMIKKQIRS